MKQKRFSNIFFIFMILFSMAGCSSLFSDDSTTDEAYNVTVTADESTARAAIPTLPSNLVYSAMASNGVTTVNGVADEADLKRFVLQLPAGTWTVTIYAKSGDLTVLQGSVDATIDSTGKYVLSIPVFYTTSGTGTINLSITVPQKINSLVISGTTAGLDGTYSVSGGTINIAPASSIASGTYNALLTFKDASGNVLVTLRETINVRDNMQTATWEKSGSEPYLQSNNGTVSFNITDSILDNLIRTTFYVHGTDGVLSAATGTPTGTWKQPYASLEEALTQIGNINDQTSTYTIMLDGKLTTTTGINVTLTDVNLKICGLNGNTKDILEGTEGAYTINVTSDTAGITYQDITVQKGRGIVYGSGTYGSESSSNTKNQTFDNVIIQNCNNTTDISAALCIPGTVSTVTITLKNGTKIINNTKNATSQVHGCSLFVRNNKVIIDGSTKLCEISGNEITTKDNYSIFGAGICTQESEVILSDCKILNNSIKYTEAISGTSPNHIAGVQIICTTPIEINNHVEITGNTTTLFNSTPVPENLNFDGNTLKIGASLTGSSIGINKAISTINPLVFTSNTTTLNLSSYFTSDSKYGVGKDASGYGIIALSKVTLNKSTNYKIEFSFTPNSPYVLTSANTFSIKTTLTENNTPITDTTKLANNIEWKVWLSNDTRNINATDETTWTQNGTGLASNGSDNVISFTLPANTISAADVFTLHVSAKYKYDGTNYTLPFDAEYAVKFVKS